MKGEIEMKKRGYTVVFKDPHPIWGGETRVIRFAANRDEVISWAKDEVADVRASFGIEIEIRQADGQTVWASHTPIA
jgi:hypothetical protein